MTPQQKADEICKNHIFDSNHFDCCMEMAQWKGEQFEKEKQALIQKYENKLNKLNQREKTIRDNVRRANSRYGFEGLF